jgi:hypothetical protein
MEVDNSASNTNQRSSVDNTSFPLISSVTNSKIITALPYIDLEYEKYQQKVDQLIAEEMKTFKPQDFLQNLPNHQLKFKVNIKINLALIGHQFDKSFVLFQKN